MGSVFRLIWRPTVEHREIMQVLNRALTTKRAVLARVGPLTLPTRQRRDQWHSQQQQQQHCVRNYVNRYARHWSVKCQLIVAHSITHTQPRASSSAQRTGRAKSSLRVWHSGAARVRAIRVFIAGSVCFWCIYARFVYVAHTNRAHALYTLCSLAFSIRTIYRVKKRPQSRR